VFTFTFIHLADAFIQSNLQLLYMSEGLSVLLRDTWVSNSGIKPGSLTPKVCVLSTATSPSHHHLSGK